MLRRVGMPFEFERQKIRDVILVKPKVFGDNRGYFMEAYKKSDFFANGIDVEFNQDNQSKSTAHVLRGLHYQEAPYGQSKLVFGNDKRLVVCVFVYKFKVIFHCLIFAFVCFESFSFLGDFVLTIELGFVQ